MKRLIVILLVFLTYHLYTQEHISLLDTDIELERKTNHSSFKDLTIPFHLHEGMILVDAFVNNEKGKFIIDTGAPTLVLNRQPKDNNAIARGISGALPVDEILVDHFSWAIIQKGDLAAFNVDMSHLESNADEKIAGIIGYDILKEVELLIDYPSETLYISPNKSKENTYKKPIAIIPFKMQGHLPVIKVKIGDKKLKLILDTASESNVLCAKRFSEIAASDIQLFNEEEIQGIDQQIKKVQCVEVAHTKINKTSLGKMKYLVTDLSHLRLEGNLFVDGILGYSFFKKGKMSINYRDKKIYIWSFDSEN